MEQENLQVDEEMMNDEPQNETPEDGILQEQTEEQQPLEQHEQPEDEHEEEPMFTSAQMQAEVDRVLQKRLQGLKSKEQERLEPYMQLADVLRQGAGLNVEDPRQLTQIVKGLFEENGVEFKEQPQGLPQREQEILGSADAQNDIELGIDYVLECLENYEQTPPMDFREIKRAQELAEFASNFFAASALEEKGIKANKVLQDPEFQKFAAKYRSDIPITEIYADFQKLNGQQPKQPKSTGSVKGQGKTGETFFTQQQVAAMTREEIKKNFDVIERSKKHWYK